MLISQQLRNSTLAHCMISNFSLQITDMVGILTLILQVRKLSLKIQRENIRVQAFLTPKLYSTSLLFYIHNYFSVILIEMSPKLILSSVFPPLTFNFNLISIDLQNMVLMDSVQSLSRVQLFVTPRTATSQSSLSINSQSLLKLMSIESVMPSHHFILCHPHLLLPSIFPNIRVFSNEKKRPFRFFTSGGQSIGASASVLLMNIQD